jgi:hypothetical protein
LRSHSLTCLSASSLVCSNQRASGIAFIHLLSRTHSKLKPLKSCECNHGVQRHPHVHVQPITFIMCKCKTFLYHTHVQCITPLVSHSPCGSMRCITSHTA